MPYSRTLSLCLTLASLLGVSVAMSLPAAAQDLTYTLSGVTFNDGAVATGYFDFNPTTQIFGAYDITTTNGVTDDLTGTKYSSSGYPFPGFGSYLLPGNGPFLFIGDSLDGHTLDLLSLQPITGPGLYALYPGILQEPYQLIGSGELAPTSRIFATGSLYVTEFNPVPEASTTVTFGLLLALGMCSRVVAARKKKAPAA